MPTDEEIRAKARERLQAQIDLIVAANPHEVAWHLEGESEDLSDFRFLYDPTAFLVRAGREGDVTDVLATEYVVDDPPNPDDDPDLAAVDLVRFPLPSARNDGEPPRVLQALDLIDAEFGVPDTIDQNNSDDLDRVVASPDHWLHVCPVGNGRICPAIEPRVTEETKPWPPRATDSSLGSGVRVSVVDSGWHPPAALDRDTRWLAGVDGDPENNGQVLRQYAGHGTFVAGVIKCFAPAAEVRVEGFLRRSGAIKESRMVTQLGQALKLHAPHIINLSAGTTTRKNRPLLSFERFFTKRLSPLEGACLLVAAAGNEGVDDPFWPASFDWALGVGSLNRSGKVSGFSNFGSSAEVYAVGRDIVNAFPTGSYKYREPPRAGRKRVFRNGLARWSGTSFSAPMVAGLIAAELTGRGDDVMAAKQAVLGTAFPSPGPGNITVQALPIPS